MSFTSKAFQLGYLGIDRKISFWSLLIDDIVMFIIYIRVSSGLLS